MTARCRVCAAPAGRWFVRHGWLCREHEGEATWEPSTAPRKVVSDG